MNDLEQFRAALQSPDPSLRPLDISSIMQAGTRVRRRRRLLVGAGSGLAVLALLVGGNVLVRVAQPAAPPPAGVEVGGAPAATSVPPSAPRSAPPSATAPGPPSGATSPPGSVDPSDDDVLGEILPTGQKAGDGQWVIYMIRLDPAGLPNTTMGIKATRLLPSGTLVGGYLSNETEGSDRAEGFHATSGSQNIDYVDMPAFGYYVGPATRITAKAGGRTVEATLKRWSEDPDVVIFWFDLDSVGPDDELDGLTAYDEDGGRLPGGRSTVAVG